MNSVVGFSNLGGWPDYFIFQAFSLGIRGDIEAIDNQYLYLLVNDGENNLLQKYPNHFG